MKCFSSISLKQKTKVGDEKDRQKEKPFSTLFLSWHTFLLPTFLLLSSDSACVLWPIILPKTRRRRREEAASVFFPLSSRLGSVVLFSSLRGKYRNVRENSNLVVQLSAKSGGGTREEARTPAEKKRKKPSAFLRFRNFCNPPKRGMVAHMLNWTPSPPAAAAPHCEK